MSTHDVRRSVRTWISQSDYTHFLTLNSERELSRERMKSIFGRFCHDVDRLIFSRNNVKNVPSEERFRAIAFPEHLETNAHLHVCADLRPLMAQFADLDMLHARLRSAWLRATRGAGSFHIQPWMNDGAARYASKDALKSDPFYFLASDFHPN